MFNLVTFMNNPVGRLLRVALGIAIIAVALISLEGNARLIVAAVGLLPLVLGVSGRCSIELIPSARSSHR